MMQVSSFRRASCKAIFQDQLSQRAEPLIVTMLEPLIGRLCRALMQHSSEDEQDAVLRSVSIYAAGSLRRIRHAHWLLWRRPRG
jgi:hypothetical protein